MNRYWILAGWLALTAGYALAEPVDRDNVVIVLDGSGSMADRMGRQVKMDAAKEAIREVLQTVPPTTQIGLLAFTSDRDHRGWVFPLGPRDDEALLAALAPVAPGGHTPLGEYLKIAADRLLQERGEQMGYGTYRLLAVTDGQASDSDKMMRYTPEIMARGITLDVIGVAMDGDHMLATKVHSYRKADDPASLKEALQDVLAEVSSDGGGLDGGDAFELIAALPDGMADSVLEALQTGSNSPIGEQPRRASSARPRAGDPAGGVPHPAPAPQAPSHRRFVGFGDLVVLCILVVLGFKVLKRIVD